jgi:DNA-binding CsgD family transcriptional regulator
MAANEKRDQEIVSRLRSGSSCSQIARELGLSLSVVSGVAIAAGFRSRTGRRFRFDWAAIRSYYEAGHSRSDCLERFGVSGGAWDQAIKRGDIVPRSRRDPARHKHRTRNAVADGLAAGKSQAEIARELGLSKGTVAFHARRIGLQVDDRFARRYDWEQIQEAYDSGLTMVECRERFGFCGASWSQAVARGDIRPRPRKEPIESVLSNGRRRARFHVKSRIFDAGLKAPRCERCGLEEWQGERISLELHHVNGDHRDNRLEALEILCPNCHALTENFGRKGAFRKPPTGLA